MKKYHKINSIYKRDMSQKNAPFIIGEYSKPEFKYLKDNMWEFSEKIDGTNIRVMLSEEGITFGGKTDNAQIPAFLVTKLNELFLPIPRKKLLRDVFDYEWEDICLYGEGFGNRIQGKIGLDYLGENNVDFCLFDVRVGDWWLQRKDVYDIGKKLSLKTPNVVGTGTFDEAITLVKLGFKSSFGTAKAEGLVLRPTTELKARKGWRIITKVKCRDFA